MNKEEFKFQCKFVEWLKSNDVFVWAVPNGANTSKIEKINLIREGLLPGVADLVVMKEGGETVFLELKTAKGTLREGQKKFQTVCEKLGFKYVVVRPHMDFKKLLEELK